MKNKFASFINTMLVLLPISLVIVSCKKEEEDKQQDNAPSHVEAVDLGLSVKWANCNIGASTPEAVGAYYAWGETEEKEEYTLLTYKYYLGDLNEDGNYSNSEEYKNIGRNISGTAYDVVRTKWGGTWRMPTKKELEELCFECSWEAAEINGVKGKLITGPNGNSIFLPFAGRRYSIPTNPSLNIYDVGTVGVFWSGTFREQSKYYYGAYTLTTGYPSLSSQSDRYHGHPIRPVKSK